MVECYGVFESTMVSLYSLGLRCCVGLVKFNCLVPGKRDWLFSSLSYFAREYHASSQLSRKWGEIS